ncbi:hypothetical protein EG328_003061 [Venturia inaequalis]|uniref:Uncharacterized protein n=1 Tax=Venturia inaequalis TaxID=5025 RepID=A0A8H3VVU9_VENIN|nr:hypothetical protein EG328_003061 [Venturia inaequalis]KAE9993843.1 hypothetical protein EG327_002750 [Venturia inaequalis]RDI84629.1 hypothetical protein Vi05172_g5360 [Venturia inaequalis]
MKFTSTLALTAALVTGVWADYHDYALCYYGPRNLAGYHEAATRKMCETYRKRTGGGLQWETCPDCVITGSPPTCHSAGWHLGGDQVSSYCKGAGAAGSFGA